MAWILWALAWCIPLVAVIAGAGLSMGWLEHRRVLEQWPSLASALVALIWFGGLSAVVPVIVKFAPGFVPTPTVAFFEACFAAYSVMMALIFRSRLVERRTQRFLREQARYDEP